MNMTTAAITPDTPTAIPMMMNITPIMIGAGLLELEQVSVSIVTME